MDAITSEIYYQRFLATESQAAQIVDSFRNNEGVNLWPVLKRRYFADHHLFSPAPPVYGHPLAPRRFLRATRRLSPRVRQALATIPTRQALIFTRKSVHVRKLGGRFYDPYLDPIIPSLADLDLLPIKLVLENSPMPECHYPPLEVPVVMQTVPVRSEKLRDINGYEEYSKFSAFNESPIVPQALLHAEWSNILSHSELFQDILSILQPKAVILEEYYNPVSMGLAHACRSIGIPCIEYQHGMQCNHIMYMFQHVPTWGFETIPKWFITWGPRPAAELAARFGQQHFHRVCVGGKPENIAWARGDYEEERTELESLKERIGSRKAILVPLKLSVEDPALDALRKTILDAPEQWIWLLRQHPIVHSNELNLPPDLPTVESTLSTKLSLNSVLSATDHVVSGISSVCLDAMFAHGIPVTILGANATYYYRDFVDPELATIANDPEAISDSISRGRRRQQAQMIPDAYISSDTSLLVPALRRIMARQIGLVKSINTH